MAFESSFSPLPEYAHFKPWVYKEALEIVRTHPDLTDQLCTFTHVYGVPVTKLVIGDKVSFTWQHRGKTYAATGARQFLSYIAHVFH